MNSARRLVVPAVLAVAASALGAGCGPAPVPPADSAVDVVADAGADAANDACASPNFRCSQAMGGGACTPEFVCVETQCPAGCVAMPPI